MARGRSSRIRGNRGRGLHGTRGIHHYLAPPAPAALPAPVHVAQPLSPAQLQAQINKGNYSNVTHAEALIRFDEIEANNLNPDASKNKAGAKKMVKNYLTFKMLTVDPHHQIFGPLSDTQLRMPRLDTPDARFLSWQKFINGVSQKLNNVPSCIEDCWFIPAASQKDYAIHNIGPKNVDNRFQVHRILAVLENPNQYDKLNTHEKKTNTSWVCAHRCGRGKYSGLTCINPRHIHICLQAENLSHRGCENGCTFLCPHTPRCIFTNANGYWMPCRNREDMLPLPGTCHHNVKCLEKKLLTSFGRQGGPTKMITRSQSAAH